VELHLSRLLQAARRQRRDRLVDDASQSQPHRLRKL
jgi:hypothetical protein